MNRGNNPWDHIESEMTVLHVAALFCILPYSTYQGLESDFSFFFFLREKMFGALRKQPRRLHINAKCTLL